MDSLHKQLYRFSQGAHSTRSLCERSGSGIIISIIVMLLGCTDNIFLTYYQNGKTLLRTACESGHTELANILNNAGATMDDTDDDVSNMIRKCFKILFCFTFFSFLV